MPGPCTVERGLIQVAIPDLSAEHHVLDRNGRALQSTSFMVLAVFSANPSDISSSVQILARVVDQTYSGPNYR